MSDPAIKACEEYIASCGVDTYAADWKTSLKQPPVFPFEQGKSYFWKLETNVGPIDNMVVTGNYLYGGSYTVYLRDKGTGNGAPTNSAVVDNVFAASTSGVFASCLDNGNSHSHCNTRGSTVSLAGEVDFTGNVFDNGTSL